MNLKKLTSLLLTLVMVISLMPMAAFAENIPADSGSDTSYEEQLDEKETEAASSEEDQPAEATAAELVQAKIDALPAASELQGKSAAEVFAVNDAVTAISMEIDKLTAEEQSQLKMDKIMEVAGFLATYVAPVADDSGLVVKYRLTENGVVTTDWTVRENQDRNDTNNVVMLDYSKNAVLEIEAYYNGTKLGKEAIEKATQGDKNAYITDKDGVSGAINGDQDNPNVNFVGEDGTVTVKPGKRIGSTQIEMEIRTPDADNTLNSFCIVLSVVGFTDPPTPSTDAYLWYKNAKIIPATDKTAPVEVCATAGASLDAEYTEKGFYISGGKVYLDASEKTENLFDITVDGQNYSVVFVQQTATFTAEELAARTVSVSDYKITAETVGNVAEGYNVVSYNSRDNEWCANTEFGEEKFGIVNTGTESAPAYAYYPIYIVKADNNGNLVSTDDTAQIKFLQGNTNWIKVEKVNIGTESAPINAYRLAINPQHGEETVTATLYSKATVGLFTENSSPKELELSTYSLEDIPYKQLYYKYGLSAPVHDYLDEKWDSPQTAVSVEKTFDEINGTNPFANIVLTQGSGSPLYVENALHDMINASSFKVTTKNGSKLDVKYTSKDSKGYNCIGFNIALKDGVDTSTDVLEEFKIEYTTIDPNAPTFYIYGSVFIHGTPDLESESATVDNVENFITKYLTMPSGTITLEAGPYEFADTFVHYRDTISIEGAEGAKVVFTREAGSLGPVITVEGKVDDGIIKNIIVDGNNERIGVYGKPISGEFTYFTLENVTVRNCTTGVVNETATGDTILTNCVIENNDIGVKSHMDAPDVANSTFKGNTTAVYVGENTFSVPVVINSNFVDNTTDLATESESTEVKIRQNFFGATDAATNKVKMKTVPTIAAEANGNTDIVYYSPYYTTIEKNTLDATLEGAEVKSSAARTAATTYVLPVDLEINPASVMKNDVFADIEAGEAIEISTTNEDGTATWVYSQETLSTTMDFDATETNIAVSDTLTDGSATVDSNKGDATVYQSINFAHSGYLPGDARITVDGALNEDAKTAELYLYHVVDGTLKLEEDAAVEVFVDTTAEKNYYSFTSDHCSEYIISTKIVVEESGDNTGDGGTGGEGEADGTTGGGAGSTGGSTSGSSSSSSSASTVTPAPTATPAVPAQSAAQATPTVNDFVSALDVEEKLEASATGEAVIDITGKDLVSSKAFEVLAENPDKTLVFETDGFKWTFAASDITDANAISGTTFKPVISLDSPNVDEIKALAGDAAEGFTHIYFQHHGKLPGKAKVEIFVGKADAGVTKHVYHYLPERGGFEYMGTTVITQDGWAAFEIYGCSDYILSDVMLDTSLVLEAETEAPAPEANIGDTETEFVPESPAENGGFGTLPIIIVVAVIAVAAIFFILRRKGEKEE